MKSFLSFYHPKLPVYLVYMLQQVDYDPGSLLRWILRLPQLTAVMYRKKLVPTAKAKALAAIGYMLLLASIGLAIAAGLANLGWGLIMLLLVPFLTAGLFVSAVLAAWLIIEQPRRKADVARAQAIFNKHPAVKIAIAGSYGKTTMKELLLAVLASEKNVAATPGNKNVLISHARWAGKLGASEDILLIEYGEGAPGDIERFARLSKPDIAIITGLAPNHLDRYKTLAAVADDLLSIAKFVPAEQLFINRDDEPLTRRAPEGANGYDHQEVLGWKIKITSIGYQGTEFSMHKDGEHLALHSPLLGRHQVGPLALAAALSKRFGVSSGAITKALASLEPYEHRMQPRQQAGAWIIDDTYNGNLQGIKAGLQLLEELPAKRKIYVTPGLVDQGSETERVHREIGQAIAKANPDRTILMQNSAAKHIAAGLAAADYSGQVEIIDKPLEFYTSMDHILAAGDLILLQNDWTDNYA